MARSLLTPSERIRLWQEGVEFFNTGRYWHAHEAWEKGWLTLPSVQRLHIQSLIQVTGALHLLSIDRTSAAQALARTALAKIQEVRKEGGVESILPRVEIPGAEETLSRIASPSETDLKKSSVFSLRAKLLL